MAATPQFAGTPALGAAALSATADAGYTAPANAATVLTAGASGSKVDEIVFQGIGSTLAGTITVFLYDGATYHLVDTVAVPAVAASTTVTPWRLAKQYANLVLKSGWSLRCSSTVANQLVKVSAFGGDF